MSSSVSSNEIVMSKKSSRRKIRRTGDLICLNITASEEYAKPREETLLRSTTKKKKNLVLPIEEDILEEVPVSRRRILRAKRHVVDPLDNQAGSSGLSTFGGKRKTLRKLKGVKDKTDTSEHDQSENCEIVSSILTSNIQEETQKCVEQKHLSPAKRTRKANAAAGKSDIHQKGSRKMSLEPSLNQSVEDLKDVANLNTENMKVDKDRTGTKSNEVDKDTMVAKSNQGANSTSNIQQERQSFVQEANISSAKKTRKSNKKDSFVRFSNKDKRMSRKKSFELSLDNVEDLKVKTQGEKNLTLGDMEVDRGTRSSKNNNEENLLEDSDKKLHFIADPYHKDKLARKSDQTVNCTFNIQEENQKENASFPKNKKKISRQKNVQSFSNSEEDLKNKTSEEIELEGSSDSSGFYLRNKSSQDVQSHKDKLARKSEQTVNCTFNIQEENQKENASSAKIKKKISRQKNVQSFSNGEEDFKNKTPEEIQLEGSSDSSGFYLRNKSSQDVQIRDSVGDHSAKHTNLSKTQENSVSHLQMAENKKIQNLVNTSTISGSGGRKRWILPAADSPNNKIELYKVMKNNVETKCDDESYEFSLNDDSLADKNMSPSVFVDADNFSSVKLDSSAPSTSGSVSSKRRRTYDLEESVTDISILKSASLEDSKRIPHSDLNAYLNNSNVTTTSTFSKVTLRRKLIPQDSAEELLDDIAIPLAGSLDETFDTNVNNKTPKAKLSRRSTSTPKSAKRTDNNLSLKKEFQNSFSRSTNTTSSSVNKSSFSFNKSNSKIKKTKMPNFALIHQKAMEKMEDISEYQTRKNERAKFLLSGQKPSQESSRKERQVTFTRDTVERKLSPFHIPLPNTPKPKKRVQVDFTDSPKTPVFNKFSTVFRKQTPKITKENVFRFETKKTPLKAVNAQILAPKNINVPREQGVNRFGFRTLALPKKDAVKNMVLKKSKAVGDKVEERRNLIKGVRSNRRFDLLMKMRDGKK